MNLIEKFEDNPVIAGVNSDSKLEKVIKSDCDIVFLLYGDICNLSNIVKTLKYNGKLVFVDIDFIEGLSLKEISIDFIFKIANLDGIISSKNNIVKIAKNKGYFAIHRFFLIDSKSFFKLPNQIYSSGADIVEILPGAMPKVISWVKEKVDIPVITSGLICEKEDVINALQAGAVSISSTNTTIWKEA